MLLDQEDHRVISKIDFWVTIWDQISRFIPWISICRSSTFPPSCVCVCVCVCGGVNRGVMWKPICNQPSVILLLISQLEHSQTLH